MKLKPLNYNRLKVIIYKYQYNGNKHHKLE